MNIYRLRFKLEFFLLIFIVSIGIGSLWYTDSLVNVLKVEEQKRISVWAEVYRLLNTVEESDQNLDFYLHVMENNTTIPVIITDRDRRVRFWSNLDSVKIFRSEYISGRLEEMSNRHTPIELDLHSGNKQYLYYDDSSILYQLSYYPFIQFGIISVFICVAYIAFSSTRRAEQNRVWAGLSKETAHQLGTPVSSLLAITEIAKMQVHDAYLLTELEKDVSRLQAITERFSKIGSKPATPVTNLGVIIENSLDYIRKRSSERVAVHYSRPEAAVMVPLSAPLFSWVIENLCKNALDAISGAGTIQVKLMISGSNAVIDVSDTGKGISGRRFKTVFKPGYTTKSRGWGLGLSLARRIIEEYHNGRIFVLRSTADKGTTFRIILKSV